MEDDPFATFCKAVAETGLLSWWVSTEDGTFQVEFTGAQLWNPPDRPGFPPSSTMALRFSYDVTASFLRHKEAPEELPQDWPIRLHNDQIKPLRVNSGKVLLGENLSVQAYLDEADEVFTFHGPRPDAAELLHLPYRFAVWAQGAGLVIASKHLVLLNHDGEVDFDDVPAMHKKWWAYWRDYWRLKQTGEPLPTDYTCEATVPIKD